MVIPVLLHDWALQCRIQILLASASVDIHSSCLRDANVIVYVCNVGGLIRRSGKQVIDPD